MRVREDRRPRTNNEGEQRTELRVEVDPNQISEVQSPEAEREVPAGPEAQTYKVKLAASQYSFYPREGMEYRKENGSVPTVFEAVEYARQKPPARSENPSIDEEEKFAEYNSVLKAVTKEMSAAQHYYVVYNEGDTRKGTVALTPEQARTTPITGYMNMQGTFPVHISTDPSNGHE